MSEYSFRILGFSKDTLADAFSNDKIPKSQVTNHAGVEYLFGYLNDLKTKTIVIEYNYIDGDYLDDYSVYYVKCFGDYNRRCKRLHFLKKHPSFHPLSDSTFTHLISKNCEQSDLKSFMESYNGFSVARPLPEAIIGRTLLKTYDNNGQRRHFTAVKSNKANLFGIPIEFESLAFQEQDTVLAACATVALWSSFHKCSELFGTRTYSPAQITKEASQVIHHARPIPSRGLRVEQICNSIKSVGLEPEVFAVTKTTPINSLIYGYLKAGIPVILGVDVEGIGLHAITLVGYSLKDIPCISHEVSDSMGYIPSMGLRINEFYAHDDQIGPFARMEVIPHSDEPVYFTGSWKDNQSGLYRRLFPKVICVPVYNKIRVNYLDVRRFLTKFHKVIKSLIPSDAKSEWDLYLTTTNRYKKDTKATGILSDEIIQKIILTQYPRFLWKAILRVNNIEIVELLADATDMARSLSIFQINWCNEKYENAFNSLLQNSQLHNDLVTILDVRFYNFLKESN